MTLNDMDGMERRFVQALFEQTNGDAARSASMYRIGEILGLDKAASLRTAEMLMGAAMVEIRSLSGTIGFTEEGIRAAAASVSPGASDKAHRTLCRTPVLDAESARWVEQTAAELKAKIGRLNADYDSLTELIADLKTLDAQLMSPRPKTAVFREILRSLRQQLESGDRDLSTKIGDFLAD